MTHDRRLHTLRRLALACVLLMLAVTTASAWLRLAQPRPACADWPACRMGERMGERIGERPAAAAVAPQLLGAAQMMAVVRGTHRVVASAVLVVVLAIAVLALARPPRRALAGGLALVLLGLALGLAVLGIVTPGSRSAAVLLGNLCGGLLMLALSWRLLLELRGAPRAGRGLARAALCGAVLWVVQAALGALSGAGQMAAAPLAHVSVALVVLSLAVGVAWVAHREGLRAEGMALLCIAVLQFLLGASAAGLAAMPAVVLLHNVGAACGLALLAGLARPALASA